MSFARRKVREDKGRSMIRAPLQGAIIAATLFQWLRLRLATGYLLPPLARLLE